MKPLYISRHARRRMRRHGIVLEEIEEVVSSPDNIETTQIGRTNAIKSFNSRFIRVTYEEEEDRIVIITATPRRRM